MSVQRYNSNTRDLVDRLEPFTIDDVIDGVMARAERIEVEHKKLNPNGSVRSQTKYTITPKELCQICGRNFINRNDGLVRNNLYDLGVQPSHSPVSNSAPIVEAIKVSPCFHAV